MRESETTMARASRHHKGSGSSSTLQRLAVTSEVVLHKRKFVRRRSIGPHRYIVGRVSLRSYKNGEKEKEFGRCSYVTDKRAYNYAGTFGLYSRLGDVQPGCFLIRAARYKLHLALSIAGASHVLPLHIVPNALCCDYD